MANICITLITEYAVYNYFLLCSFSYYTFNSEHTLYENSIQ